MRTEVLTLDQVAARVGVSKRAVSKRAGLERYVVGRESGGGRPRILLDPAVVRLWDTAGAIPAQQEEVQLLRRKHRNDCGLPRKVTRELWTRIVDRVFNLYVSAAQDNLRLACEQAEKQLRAEGVDVPINVYRRLSRTDKNHDGSYISEYRQEGWKIERMRRLRKRDFAVKELPTARYDWLSIGEKIGWIGEGFGALRFWSIDGRSGDAWGRNEQGDMVMPNAVYIRDALTGMMLWVEECEEETSEAIIRAYLNCGMYWQRFPDLGVAVDNGRSMISERTRGVIESTLPDSVWQYVTRYPEIYGKQNPSPVISNLPNIPRAHFKAALERAFKQIKDEYDATRHALTYQGGTRLEAVQHAISNQTTAVIERLQQVPAVGEYFRGLWDWLLSDYILRERPKQFPLLVERGLSPTIYNAFRLHYDPTPNLPTGERLAYLLYWATAKKAFVKARLGYCEATISGQYWHCVADCLDHSVYGRKIAVVPIPGANEAVLMLADDKSNPRYIGTVRNLHVRDMDTLTASREIVPATHAAIRERVSRATAARQDGAVAWSTVEEPKTLAPAPMHEPEPEHIAKPARDLIVDDETAALLGDIEHLFTNAENE